MRRLLLALSLLASGCQPVPHPFADNVDRPAVSALRPRDSAGILVLPVAGAPDPAASALATSLAEALRQADVPASTDAGNRGSFRLETTTSEEPLAPGRARVTLAWSLKAADGAQLGAGEATRDAASAAWEKGDPDLAAALSHDAVRVIAPLVTGDAPAAASVGPIVAVRAVTGAPGDGGTALANAIGAALGHAGVEVAGGGAKARFALSCVVAVSPPKDGQQSVAVRWVLALSEGREMGQVSQQNTVPAGSLDGAWGDVAYAVAAAAAPEIALLIERAKLAAPELL
ncbi:MAG TPA: hypothetical protein VN802_00610 [Stellaceae bacterium]|nr:hypothetical protein [Stellaceae bacterium]